jgi:hypothetical protein
MPVAAPDLKPKRGGGAMLALKAMNLFESAANF